MIKFFNETYFCDSYLPKIVVKITIKIGLHCVLHIQHAINHNTYNIRNIKTKNNQDKITIITI